METISDICKFDMEYTLQITQSPSLEEILADYISYMSLLCLIKKALTFIMKNNIVLIYVKIQMKCN